MSNTTNSAPSGAKKEETLIINQYQYTTPMVEEVQDAFAKQSYKNFGVLIIITLICGFFTYREFVTHKMAFSILFAVVGLISLISVIAAFISTNNKKKAAIESFRQSYGSNGLEYKITIEGNHVRSFKDNVASVDIRKSDIRGSFESERFFIFQLSGEQLLPLKKGSFIVGNIDACKNYLPKALK